MVFKSNSKVTNQSNNCNPFKVGGLIFDSEEDYKILENIDIKISLTVEKVNNGRIDLNDVFNNIKTFNVKETYYGADEELYGLFKNATYLLCLEGTRFVNDYEVGRCFFSKINVIYYNNSDDIYDRE